MPSTANRIAKNTSFLYIKMGITVFISLYSTRLVLNALGASDFGIFNVVGGAIAMLAFLNGAMSSTTQRFMSYSEGEGILEAKKETFNSAVFLHLCIALVLGLFLFLIKPLVFDHMLRIESSKMVDAEWIYNFMIISTLFTVINVPYSAVINSHENMLYYSIIGIVESVLKLLVALFISSSVGNKLIWYGLLMAAISATIAICMFVYCKSQYVECEFSPTKYLHKTRTKEMAGFAFWSFLGSSAGIISGYGNNIVLNHFFGTRLNAANGVCGQINGQLQAFSNNLIKAVNPVIVKSEGAHNRERLFKVTFSSCKISVLLYAVLAIPFIVDCPYILRIWLVNVPPYTLIFCQLAVFQVIFEQISNPLGTVIGAVGKVRLYNILDSIILYLCIIAVYVSFRLGGSPAFLPIISLSTAFTLMILNVIYSHFYCDMSLKQYLTDVFFRCMLIILITFLGVYFFHGLMKESFLRLIITVIVTFIIFIPLFYVVVLNPSEKDAAKGILSNMRVKFLHKGKLPNK